MVFLIVFVVEYCMKGFLFVSLFFYVERDIIVVFCIDIYFIESE